MTARLLPSSPRGVEAEEIAVELAEEAIEAEAVAVELAEEAVVADAVAEELPRRP